MTVGTLRSALNMQGSGVPLDGLLLSSGKIQSHSQKQEKAMTRPEEEKEKGEMRIMWIGSAVIVLLILAAMGFNMLITHDTNGGSSAETTGSLSGTVPPK
jgi:hypothetical protein